MANKDILHELSLELMGLEKPVMIDPAVNPNEHILSDELLQWNFSNFTGKQWFANYGYSTHHKSIPTDYNGCIIPVTGYYALSIRDPNVGISLSKTLNVKKYYANTYVTLEQTNMYLMYVKEYDKFAYLFFS